MIIPHIVEASHPSTTRGKHDRYRCWSFSFTRPCGHTHQTSATWLTSEAATDAELWTERNTPCITCFGLERAVAALAALAASGDSFEAEVARRRREGTDDAFSTGWRARGVL
jgi:hypothetical protein